MGYKVKISIDVDVPDENRAYAIVRDDSILNLIGQSVVGVALADEEINTTWNDKGFHVAAHIHNGDPDDRCYECRNTLSVDEIMYEEDED